MKLQLLLVIVALFAAAHAQTPGSGNATARLAECESFVLPQLYQPYTEISFLGQRKYITAGTVEYAYFQFGPLLAKTGQGATASVWTPDLLKPLAQGRQIIIFDNRGIGLSADSSTEDYTVSSYAESTVELMEALGLRQPDVLGWSFGGIIALEIATRVSGVIGSLVLADTQLGGKAYGLTPAGQEASEAFSLVEQDVAAGITIPAANIFPDTAVGNKAMCRFLNLTGAMPADKVSQAQNLRQAQAVLDFHGPDSDAGLVYERLGNVTNPTLVLAGGQDHVDPISADVAIADAVPGAVLVQFGDAGHAALLQHSLQAASLISAFLDEQELPEGRRYL